MNYDLLVSEVQSKVNKVNVNNPKANAGAKLIRVHGGADQIDDFLKETLDILQALFEYNYKQVEGGTAPLTMASIAIGSAILESLDYRGETRSHKIDQVRVGDLFIEVLVKHSFVTLEYPKKRDAGYTIQPTEKWEELCDSLGPEDVNLRGTKGEPYRDGVRVKCASKGYTKRSQNTVWCRAAEKLQQSPWKINKPVYEALRANQAMFLNDVPHEDPKEDKRRISKNSEFLGVMRFASQIVDKYDDFYQEVYLDYRGRIYFHEKFMHFQSSDPAKGMMMFAEGKPLDQTGQYWLAVHTATSYNETYDVDAIPEWCEADYRSHLEHEGLDSISVDKFTLDDRVRWTNANMDTIIEAGGVSHLFEEAEEPVSFLACCLEWYNFSVCEGVYLSHLPVPVDGSNNGWQHLGAISKDPRTGKLVGLVTQEIQQDFYVKTAKQLLEIDDPKLNAMPTKHVRKGISKRGSMTRAYSAGAGTIGYNMWRDCRTYKFDELYGIEESDCKRWANELIKAINIVCSGPLSTMEYLQKLAAFQIGTYKKYRDGEPAGKEYFELQKELSKLWSADEKDLERIEELLEEAKEYYSVLVEGNGKKSIRWTTPSQFDVVYEKYREDDFKCRGTINGKQIKHVIRIKTAVPDMRGFMCGISPNYVHSMDAAHMALVIDRLDDDMSFGAIHDSFATHACDVERLIALTKSTFIEMYDVDNFYDKIRQDITGNTDNIEQPELGTLDVSGVKDSDYFFA